MTYLRSSKRKDLQDKSEENNFLAKENHAKAKSEGR